MTLKTIDPASLKRRLDDGSAILVDVREPSEYAREHIPGARLVPLAALDRSDLEAEPDKAVVICCRTGNRTAANSERLQAVGCRDAYALEGGLEAWKAAGLPTRMDPRAPLELFRQVQIAAGTLILLGLLLALLVSPWFAGLSAFVGAGLMFADLTGSCGLARLLSLMPWNRSAQRMA
jgi:rhodanese-related sulfurtransferase